MATYSWKGTTSTWSTATNWRTGGADAGSPPGVGDDCVFDGSDGGSSSAACTLTASTSVKSVNFTGYTGTFTHNSSVNLTIGSAGQTGGVATWVSGMTYTLVSATTSAIIFDADGGTNTLTSGGKTFGNITIGNSNAGLTVALGDNVTAGATATTTLTRGTLSLSSFTLSTGLFSSSNSNTRTLNFGSGKLSLTATTGTVYTTSTATNLTITGGTGTLELNATATGVRVLILSPSANGQYYKLSVANPSVNAQIIQFSVNNVTFSNDVTFTNVRNINIFNNIAFVCSGTFSWTGPSSSTPGSLTGNASNTSLSIANAVSVDWISIGAFTRTGAGSWTSNNSFDSGITSGFNISAPGASTGGAGIIGG